ncbi:MAG: hypothetical protein OXB84_07925 [Halobacteriovoraceae bacterium]|nr:hypothetical protein [Halobacteriovoraceae bacterium]
MHKVLKEHLDASLAEYTAGIHYETLIEAKNSYFSLTGQINDEDDDYEIRMDSFNDWYVLQFVSSRGTHTVIKDYLTKKNVDDNISKSLLGVNHSLFEYLGENMRKEIVLGDILHNKKCILTADNMRPGLLKKDIFVGRVLNFDKKGYLMNGMCVVPSEVRSILKKQCKKVRKYKDVSKEMDFLLQLEAMKTKWTRYGHIKASEFFNFDKDK